MTHSIHGDIHEIGLQDNCPACEMHAAEPWLDLDDVMLELLVRRNFFYRFSNDPDSDRSKYYPRSDTEGLAMARITTQMERIGQLMSHDPDHLIQDYLERKWHVDFKES